MIERTLVIIKADGVSRGLSGRIIQRFEDRGMKIVAMKMVRVDEKFAEEHYFDVAERISEKVAKGAKDYLKEGPVIAFVLEGVSVVSAVRKMTGTTEPHGSEPGTIRGDFAHMNYAWGDKRDKSLRNLIHTSGAPDEAEREIKLWFNTKEIHNYSASHEKHTFLKD